MFVRDKKFNFDFSTCDCFLFVLRPRNDQKSIRAALNSWRMTKVLAANLSAYQPSRARERNFRWFWAQTKISRGFWSDARQVKPICWSFLTQTAKLAEKDWSRYQKNSDGRYDDNFTHCLRWPLGPIQRISRKFLVTKLSQNLISREIVKQFEAKMKQNHQDHFCVYTISISKRKTSGNWEENLFCKWKM